MKTTLWNILNNDVEGHNLSLGIEIPKIQRDYAQGRISAKAKEVREVFIAELFKSISEVKYEQKPSLDLDFVYGINDNNKFIPLDGQQRLTTLYIIHWYLAFRDKKVNELLQPFSKFNYETRPTTSLFIKKLNSGLTAEDYDDIFSKNISFAKTIKNKNWYFVNWGNDITIQSMLVMLDAVHQVFKSSTIKFEDVINEEFPAITFNFLQIKDFGLSDNLYVKMNSRGKSLTNFENLKAELGKFIKESGFNNKYNYYLLSSGIKNQVTVENYFMTKADTDWCDFFWNLRDSENVFDDKLLNLLSFVSFNELIKADKNKFDESLEEFSKDGFLISHYSLSNLNLITEDSIIAYIDALDLLALDQQSVFITFINTSNFYKNTILPILERKQEASYENRLLIYGIFSFTKKAGDNLNITELQKWSRLLHNLSINTAFNKSKDFEDAILGLDVFLNNYNGDIYDSYLKNSINGFDTVQTLEEKIKISLRVKDVSYGECLDEIENQKYLRGQISSLLVFSGIYETYKKNKFEGVTKLELDLLIENLRSEFAKFQLLFDDSGLKQFINEEFRRALLTYGDYSIYSTNYCFFTNGGRETSWKRLLKEIANNGDNYTVAIKCLTNLFEVINPKLEILSSLKNIIENYLKTCEDKNWIFDFVKYPILLKSSKLYRIKFFDPGRVYPLRNTKYNKYEDPEFKSLVLKHLLTKKGIDISKLEFGFIDTNNINQYGIKYINGKSVKVVYNHNELKKFYIKPYGKDEFYEKSINKVVDYIISNYFSS